MATLLLPRPADPFTRPAMPRASRPRLKWKAFIRMALGNASEPAPGTGIRLRGGSSASVKAAATSPNQLGREGGGLQRPRPCRLCWYCCCSCSCLAVRTDEEHKDSNNEHSNQAVLPSLDEIRSWGQSFDQMMGSAAGRNVFLEYLRSEYSEENILFWQACEELKQEVNQSEVEEKARSIYEEYISMLSPKEVSLDAQVKDQVERSMKAPTPHTFDEAQQQIYTLMHRDPYKRFVKSQLFLSTAQLTDGDGTDAT